MQNSWESTQAKALAWACDKGGWCRKNVVEVLAICKVWLTLVGNIGSVLGPSYNTPGEWRKKMATDPLSVRSSGMGSKLSLSLMPIFAPLTLCFHQLLIVHLQLRDDLTISDSLLCPLQVYVMDGCTNPVFDGDTVAAQASHRDMPENGIRRLIAMNNGERNRRCLVVYTRFYA